MSTDNERYGPSEAVRAVGGCGALNQQKTRLCIRQIGHLGLHGWEVDTEADTIAELVQVLREARDELARWGWGDFHYGVTPQQPQVVAMVAKIDAVLASHSAHPEPS